MARQPTATLLAIAAALVFALPSAGSAQERPAFTLDQVERLLRANVPGIIEDLRRDCIAFDVTDEIAGRLKDAGADDAFIAQLRTVCKRLPQAQIPPGRAARADAPPQQQMPGSGGRVSPGSAAIRSLFVPGLGQFATGKPAAGVAFLAAWGGALAFGILSKEETTECLARVSSGSSCPAGDIRDTSVKRSKLGIGLGGAVAVAVVSAIHARSVASRALASGGPAGAASRLALEAVLPGPEGSGTGLQVRIRF